MFCMDILLTTTTYKTRENAEVALAKKLTKTGRTLANTRYLIAVNRDGRFAPVVFGVELLDLIHQGITVSA